MLFIGKARSVIVPHSFVGASETGLYMQSASIFGVKVMDLADTKKDSSY